MSRFHETQKVRVVQTKLGGAAASLPSVFFGKGREDGTD